MPDPAGRRVHRPGKPGLLGEAEIDAVAVDGRDIGFRATTFALEYAFEVGHRADHEADILAALALQDTGANLWQRVGARGRCCQCCDGNTECQESHDVSPHDEWNSRSGQEANAMSKTWRLRKCRRQIITNTTAGY